MALSLYCTKSYILRNSGLCRSGVRDCQSWSLISGWLSLRFVAMAAQAVQEKQTARIQVYPEKTPLISQFWKEKYENEARKYWDVFYKRNANRFFKDRHYLDKEWGQYFVGTVMDADANSAVVSHDGVPSQQTRTILEVGCGTGNTVFPLITQYPELFVYACDFSLRAVDLVKAHADYDQSRVKAFVCDATSDPLSATIPPASIHVVTLVFMLSAVGPEKMPLVLRNIKSILKPGGHILLRDYAVGDLAQERFMSKDQQISENFYVRGDGTRAYYFSEDGLKSLFLQEGFECKEMKVHCRQLENRSRKLVMDRRWIQSVFYLPEQSSQSSGIDQQIERVAILLSTVENLKLQAQTTSTQDPKFLASSYNMVGTLVGLEETYLKNRIAEETIPDNGDELIVDLSEGCGAELFGGSPCPEPLEVRVGKYTIQARFLPKENQHTYAATGFMLWESALALAELLVANPSVTQGKTILEVGCGSVGICSMVASLSAERVVATDGDIGTLSLLQANLCLNKESFNIENIAQHKLEWGHKQDIAAVKAVNGNKGFQLIIGSDVTYVQEAVPLLFETARSLLLEPTEGVPEPQFLLCHRIRKVAESDILSSAISHGFSIKGLWTCRPPARSDMDKSEIIKHSNIEQLFKVGLEEICSSYNSLQLLLLSPTVIHGSDVSK